MKFQSKKDIDRQHEAILAEFYIKIIPNNLKPRLLNLAREILNLRRALSKLAEENKYLRSRVSECEKIISDIDQRRFKDD